jgi:hypothetical protein
MSDDGKVHKPSNSEYKIVIGYVLNEGLPSFLPLGATVQGELWPPEKSDSILFCSSSFLPSLSIAFY